ncbi:hypothetical protein HYPSUDRAFT_542537 [Hypholoma sublateritium FD-334 SS-4]|uniref:Uncharacterized protein n=1 Tax=Hypholoma sublateritium (strain FD-334 SS-4) TaxID=945553 RepID=A0A0D2N2Y0_HYPSF|nr:hypothetical protein HYPSUDRAFT_542537 [Hypholoma sublateritium FD-334 SS-4]
MGFIASHTRSHERCSLASKQCSSEQKNHPLFLPGAPWVSQGWKCAIPLHRLHRAPVRLAVCIHLRCANSAIATRRHRRLWIGMQRQYSVGEPAKGNNRAAMLIYDIVPSQRTRPMYISSSYYLHLCIHNGVRHTVRVQYRAAAATAASWAVPTRPLLWL